MILSQTDLFNQVYSSSSRLSKIQKPEAVKTTLKNNQKPHLLIHPSQTD